MAPIGRPTSYTPEIGARIAERYASGATFKAIFEEEWAPDSHMTVARWEDTFPAFAKLMSDARAAHAEALIDGLEGVVAAERDPQRARIIAECRRWKASKLTNRFADSVRVEVEHRISIGDALASARARLQAISGDPAPMIEATAVVVAASATDVGADTDDEPDFMR
jgi:hypothetical protein